jgi:formylglycine-generating enzyme required for sulfatase activity
VKYWIAGALLAALAAVLLLWLVRRDESRCGPGFVAKEARCLPEGCPSPLAMENGVCRAPDVKVRVPAGRALVGPSDWEAEGRVAAREVSAGPFAIDAFELNDGQVALTMSRDEAIERCRARGGRLPTDDEWTIAASAPRRYPWGDTGAVCRRAAWGLASGPCAHGGGPDTVGSHAAGDTALGIHDMAGNVAEWVAPDPARPDVAVARGGAWSSTLATELRTWDRIELPAAARDPRIGARCVYE